jgi:hypothetical protein
MRYLVVYFLGHHGHMMFLAGLKVVSGQELLL